MKILDLPIKSKYYLMIELGLKREDYREIIPYWYIRLYQRRKEFAHEGPLNMNDAAHACSPVFREMLRQGFADDELKPYTHVRFRYGYTRRTILFKLDGITVGRGNPELGAPSDRDVFIIRFSRQIPEKEI